jgi:hypothetical protein
MAGLVPKRKTRDEIERANEELLQRHRAYLEAWIANRVQVPAHSSDQSGADEGEALSAKPGVICC